MKVQTEVAKIKPTSTKEARALETLQQELKEGIQVITLQQKHIKVADRSEFGWATVQEYDKDELARKVIRKPKTLLYVCALHSVMEE